MEGRIHYRAILKSVRGIRIFYEDSDRILFLNILNRFAVKHLITIEEFVLLEGSVEILFSSQSHGKTKSFISEVQQNFSYWYNRFHSCKDTLFAPAEIIQIQDSKGVVKSAISILQSPVNFYCREDFKLFDYPWSSYRFHYNFMKCSKSLVKSASQILKVNGMSKIINGSRSAYKNSCPRINENLCTSYLSLADLIRVDTFEVDKFFTPDDFKIILQNYYFCFH